MADEKKNEELLTAAANSLGSDDLVNMSVQSDEIDDPDLEMIKARVKEMEEEAEKIKEMQNEIEIMAHNTTGFLAQSLEEKMEIDERSIYVGNVDYETTVEELEAHFHGCGSISRISIQCDKFSGHPKGFAYIEFAVKDSVFTSIALDESFFRGRQIKVLPKRTNRPGISSTNRPPRGRQMKALRNCTNYSGTSYINQPPRVGFRGPSRPYFSGYRPVRRSFRRRSWYYPY